MELTEPIPGCVTYITGFFTPEESADLVARIRDTSAWSQERFQVRDGPTVPFPRLVAWHGEDGVGYRYSGIVHPARAWTEPLLAVRGRLQEATGIEYTGCLLNRYRDGNDSIGRHADVEDDLLPGSPIACVSLGATRTISFRPSRRGSRKSDEVLLPLEDGSLLIMRGGCQRLWSHEIAKVRPPESVGERISLTFRSVRR